jgi:fructose-1,6-bisphosphatase/inositol monophosphatase family enzyme
MPFDAKDRAELIRIARAVAKTEVMPRFRNLSASAVDTKKDAHDIVTEADTAAESALTSAFHTAFPGLDVLGEEGISANPAIIERLDTPGTTIIIDPIDGTWNYAAGQTNFGMILSVVQNGVTLFGLHLDPVMDDWIWAAPGEGAHWARDGATRPIHTRGELPLNQRIGLMSPALFPAHKRAQLVTTALAYGRALSPRCAAHEYRLIAEGHADFALGPRRRHPDRGRGRGPCRPAGWPRLFSADTAGGVADSGEPSDMGRGGGTLGVLDLTGIVGLSGKALPFRC